MRSLFCHVFGAAVLTLLVAGCTCPTTTGNGAGGPAAPAPAKPPPDAHGPAPDSPEPPGHPATPPPPPAPDQGEACPDGVCAKGLRCLSYYGIAGAAGPKFTSCEIPCTRKPGDCPHGQQCVTIADGPGQVCRPVHE